MSIPLIPTKNSVVGSATAPTAGQIPNNGQFAVNAFTGRAYMRTEGGNSVDPARVTLSGDVTGSTATATSEAQGGTVAATVAKIQGRTVASTAPTGGQSLTWNSGTSQWEPGGGTAMVGFNRIINGAMAIDQRNAGASVTPADGAYTLDRWSAGLTQASKFSVQQNAGGISGPTGFSNYIGVTSLSAYSVVAGDTFRILQPVEGFNFADFGFGTATASSVTLSFWARSSLTGTFGGSLRNSASNRSYPFTYSISAANTWEQKSITIAGDTSGTWIGATNGIGVNLSFSLGTGSTFSGTAGAWAGANYISATGATSVVAGTGNTLYITGVQLEKGTLATSFDARPYGTELALCQRYYFKWLNNSGGPRPISNMQAWTTAAVYGKLVDLPVQMRAIPTGATSGAFYPSNQVGVAQSDFTSTTVDGLLQNMLGTGSWSGSSGLTTGNCSIVYAKNNAYIDASAEL